MPPLGRGNRSVRTERVLRRKRRRPSRPSATQRAHAQERYYASQGRQIQHAANQQRQTRRHAASRRPVAFRPLPKRNAPFKVQRQRARREAERADKRIADSRAIPHIPLLSRYTAPQRALIRRTYKSAAKRAHTSPTGLYLLGSPRQRQQIRRVVRRVHESEKPVEAFRQIEYHSPPGERDFTLHPGDTFAGIGGDLGLDFRIPNSGNLGNVADLTKPFQAVGVGAFNLGRAAVEDPIPVIKSSVRTAKESIAGIPQGVKMLASASEKAVVHGDTSELESVLGQIGADYEKRYGSILSDPAKFREMVKRDYGLTPFVLDATALVGGGGAAAGAVARTGAVGRLSRLPGVAGRAAHALHEASKAEHARPRLRFGGGEAGTRGQEVSSNLIKALGQRKLDKVRVNAYRKRAEQAGWRVRRDGSLRAIPGRTQRRFEGLRPGRGEVVRAHDLRNRVPFVREGPGGVRRDIGGKQSTARLKLLGLGRRRKAEVDKLLKPLSAPERDVGVWMMLRTGAKPGRSGVAALKRRRAKIIREREAKGFEVPEVIRDTNDEVAVIDQILAEPGKYLTPKAREVANQLRDMQIEDARRVLPEQQETLRRLSPQAELLGVPRNLRDGTAAPDVAEMERLAGMLEDSAAQQRKTGVYKFGGANEIHVQRLATQLRETVDRIRSGEDVDVPGPDPREVIRDADSFIKRVREAQKAADLEEPAYWMSGTLDDLENVTRRQHATGAGLRATELPSHRYTGETHRLGVERRGREVFDAGVQRNLKRRVQHDLVARNAEAYAYSWSLNGGKGRTIAELKKLARENAIDLNSLTFLSPRILRKGEGEGEAALTRGAVARGQEAAQDAEDAMAEVHADVKKRSTWSELRAEERQGVSDQRYLAYPSDVGDVLEQSTRPSRTFQRTLELLLKTKPSRVMLGLNPPWLGIQIASNGLLAGIAGMSPLDIYGMLKFDRALKRTDPEAHAALEAELGISRGRHWQTDVGRVMAPGSRMAALSRAFSHTKVGRLAHGANAPSRIMDAMFGADAAQTAFFRKAVFYSEAKKAARLEMGKAIRGAAKAQTRMERILRLPPNELVKAIAENADLFEKHAKHVDKWLGNYTKYSSFERKAIASNVLFYGWLRHSLRLTFYTVPIEHPIMANILGNIGRLGAQDIKDLFGVPDTYNLPTHVLANVYSGTRKDAKRGVLEAANWSRMSPFLNAVTQLERPSQLAGLVSPLYQEALDQAFEESSFTGRDWRIRGEYPPSESQRPSNYYDLESHGRIALRDILSLAFPYRAAEQATLAPSQTDDALLWSPRPLNLKDPESQAGIRKSRRQRRQLGLGNALLDQLIPVRPRITTAPQMVKREREKEAALRSSRKGRRRRKRSSFSGGGYSGGGFGGGGFTGSGFGGGGFK